MIVVAQSQGQKMVIWNAYKKKALYNFCDLKNYLKLIPKDNRIALGILKKENPETLVVD